MAAATATASTTGGAGVGAGAGAGAGASSSSSSSSVVAETKTPAGEISLAMQELKELPPAAAARYGATTTKLDLTGNFIKSGANFERFTVLQELILDKNGIETLTGFPRLPTVTTLWLNNNKIADSDTIMDVVARSFPNVSYLSMMRNPACPDIYMSDGEAEAYQRYRYYIIHRLAKLQFLDATPVTPTERKEAERRGKFMKVAKPAAAPASEETKDEPVLKAISPIQPGAKPPKVATFLAKGKPRYDGTNSEGNRFICNEDL